MLKLVKGLIGLYQVVKSPGAFKTMLLNYYHRYYAGQQRVPAVEVTALLGERVSIRLENFWSRNGNVSPFELMCISAICSCYRPRTVVEIGTFDGNTTLQLALNSPPDSTVYTLDLPDGFAAGELHTEAGELQFITGAHRVKRKYQGSPVAYKVKQIFTDSARFDFQRLAGIDLVFIDGSHSYAYVKNDTEKIWPALNKGGIMIWHDYTPNWMGVWTYLNELSSRLELKNIAGTTLVVHVKD